MLSMSVHAKSTGPRKFPEIIAEVRRSVIVYRTSYPVKKAGQILRRFRKSRRTYGKTRSSRRRHMNQEQLSSRLVCNCTNRFRLFIAKIRPIDNQSVFVWPTKLIIGRKRDTHSAGFPTWRHCKINSLKINQADSHLECYLHSVCGNQCLTSIRCKHRDQLWQLILRYFAQVEYFF